MCKILSVIIPAYNMERYLRNTLSSLLIGKNQGLLDVLVINDGSNDSSLEIAQDFELKYPETFRVIDKPNGNYGSCINRGLEEARGKYVKILDADDSYDGEALSALVDRMAAIDADIFLTDYVVTDERNREVRNHRRSNLPKEEIFGGDELFSLSCNDIIAMHEVAYRTDNLRRMGYTQTEGIAFTDQEWVFMPMTTVKTAYFLPVFVYRYLVGREGQTTDSDRAARLQVQGDRTFLVQLSFFCGCGGLSPALRNYLLSHLLRNIRFTYRTYLVTAYSVLTEDMLRSFDDCIKERSMEIYDKSSLLRVHPRIPFHFIRCWRDAGRHVTLPIRIYRTFIHPIIRKLNLG